MFYSYSLQYKFISVNKNSQNFKSLFLTSVQITIVKTFALIIFHLEDFANFSNVILKFICKKEKIKGFNPTQKN